MKHLPMKRILIVTALILVCAALPVFAQPAESKRPAGFDPNRLDFILAMANWQSVVGVEIGDMTFIGAMRSRSYAPDNAELDKLIQETLKEMGLTEEAFDKLAAESADGFLEQQATMRAALVKYWSTPNPTAASQKELQNVLDGLAGKPNAGRLDEFYRRLEEKLKKLPAGPTVIEVFKDKQTRPCEVLTGAGYPCELKEHWILNMTLAPGKTANQYEGNFTIDIDFDMSKYPQAWRDMFEDVSKKNGVNMKVSNPPTFGSLVMKRGLSGKANAEMTAGRIVVKEWKGDEKTVNIDPISVNTVITMPNGVKSETPTTLKFNQEGTSVQATVGRYVGTGQVSGTSPTAPVIPYEMLGFTKRADAAKTGDWKLRGGKQGP